MRSLSFLFYFSLFSFSFALTADSLLAILSLFVCLLRPFFLFPPSPSFSLLFLFLFLFFIRSTSLTNFSFQDPRPRVLFAFFGGVGLTPSVFQLVQKKLYAIVDLPIMATISAGLLSADAGHLYGFIRPGFCPDVGFHLPCSEAVE